MYTPVNLTYTTCIHWVAHGVPIFIEQRMIRIHVNRNRAPKSTSSCFFNDLTPASFSFIVGLIHTKNIIFTTNQCEKYQSSIWRRDLNPWPFERESSPITTRLGLLPLLLFLNNFVGNHFSVDNPINTLPAIVNHIVGWLISYKNVKSRVITLIWMNNRHRMLQGMWQVLTNHTALYQSRVITLHWNQAIWLEVFNQSEQFISE